MVIFPNDLEPNSKILRKNLKRKLKKLVENTNNDNSSNNFSGEK